MKIQSGVIMATPELMRQWLVHITTSHLGNVEAGATYVVLRSGAELVYHGRNRWTIKAYAQGQRPEDKRDWRAAMHELRAAYYLHQAAMQLTHVDDVMLTDHAFARTYCGMNARYADGQVSSSRR